MTIYFTAAISQQELYGDNYKEIVKVLQSLGHTVIYEHITHVTREEILSSTHETRREHYKKVLKWIAKADMVVAELSFPSTLNVGHEVTLALEKGKPVLGLYVTGKDSAFFHGVQSEKFIYEEYSLKSLRETVESAIHYAQDQSDTRFNFFISPKHVTYLDEVSKKRKIPKSVYLRQLIEKDKANNTDFEG